MSVTGHVLVGRQAAELLLLKPAARRDAAKDRSYAQACIPVLEAGRAMGKCCFPPGLSSA